MELEHSFLKAPFEVINKQFRNSQKLIEKEISTVLSNIQDLDKKKEKISKQEAFEQIDKLSTKLQGLKRKIEEMKKEDEKELRKSKMRTEHLKTSMDLDLKKIKQKECIQWNEIRMNRIIEDYLLRSGYLNTAVSFANDANIVEFIDLDIFVAGKKVVEGLQNKECKEALKWCNDNKSKLKKIESNFEFELRIQETIEFIRNNKPVEAIQYARKHLAPSAFPTNTQNKSESENTENKASSNNMKKIQQVMAALALFPNHLCSNYKDLFSVLRWKELEEKFKIELCEVHSLPTQSLLDINIQSGLIALKSTYCNEPENANVNCPTCIPSIRLLAKELPIALHAHTVLICRISGQVMSDDNPPMILPNGFAYSKNALLEMASKNNGTIVCPRSFQTFSISELRKAFIT